MLGAPNPFRCDMRYNLSGPRVLSGVTADRIDQYSTTTDSCECPARRYSTGQDCKHIKAVKQDCSCPITLWMVHPDKGRVLLCAEDFCEVGLIRRKALLNEGWIGLPPGLMPLKLCAVCEMELSSRVDESALPEVRYCYDGEHFILPACSACEIRESRMVNADGEALCEECRNREKDSPAILTPAPASDTVLVG